LVVAGLGKGCSNACAAGLGRAKRDWSQEMGPRKYKQIQSSPYTAHTCLLDVQDIKCDPGAAFGLGKCERGAVHVQLPPGRALQNKTSLRKWGPENTSKYRTPHPPPTHAC